jgi:spherulation-specific family 4 protein
MLIPLPDPFDDSGAWSRAAVLGEAAVPIVIRPAAGLRTCLERLITCSATPIGLVSLDYGTRAPAEVADEVRAWAALPVRGIFFDHAPASPYLVGPVMRAVKAARGAGLPTIVLNAGVPVDPIYRELEATICTFEGSWAEYLRRPSSAFAPGDGHVVIDVPTGELPVARAMVFARHAGLALTTDRAEAWWSNVETRPEPASAY